MAVVSKQNAETGAQPDLSRRRLICNYLSLSTSTNIDKFTIAAEFRSLHNFDS